MADAGASSIEQLVKLSGLTERRLRELAAEGWFPKPVNGQYRLVPTIQGMLRYYREGERNRVMLDAYDSQASRPAGEYRAGRNDTDSDTDPDPDGNRTPENEPTKRWTEQPPRLAADVNHES